MIRVKNLYKTYNQNKKNECKALEGISFNLNDKGMVFVVGKSGSGKSTLLNILGGLDCCTSGNIFFGKEDISKFSSKQLENYRNNHIGFVFQDYCLIEGMSVFENIKLALSIKGEINDNFVLQTIKNVGLQNKKDTLVKFLSGGQKQRVAIARALVKSPSIILADEPTGNLDSKTSQQILSILKNLSKEKLVVVISHSTTDANKYADRIIEIGDGKITNDFDNNFHNDENLAILSANSVVSDENLNIINEKIKEDNIKIVKQNSIYKQHKDKKSTSNFNYVDSHNKMTFSSKINLFKHFFKRKIFGIFVIIFLLISLVSLIGLCQSFNNVNSTNLLLETIEKDSDPLILKKGILDDYSGNINTNYLGHVTNEDIYTFKTNGYSGDMFKLYRYSIPIETNPDQICFGKTAHYSITGGLYLVKNGLGVLQCSQEYLTSLYGNNGVLNVLSGSLDATEYGIVVTDYFADSFINKNKSFISTSSDKYEKLTSSKEPLMRRYKINAVISTNYKERYSWIIEQFKLAETYPSQYQTYVNKVKNSDIVNDFVNEVNNFLAIGYTFNENFIESTLDNARSSCVIHYFENLEITDANKKILSTNNNVWQCLDQTDLIGYESLNIKDDEIYVTEKLYNKLFSTNLTYLNQEDFVEKEIYYNLYSSGRKLGDEAKISKKLTIKGLIDHKGENACAVSENTFKQLRQVDMSAYRLYFYGDDNVSPYLTAEGLNYEVSSQNIKSILTIIKIVNIFKDIFLIILLGLFVVAIFILCGYISKSITSQKRELGILHAIGARNLDMVTPFNILSLIIGIPVAILSTTGFYSICILTNKIITKGFASIFKVSILNSLNLISFDPIIILVDLLILFAVILVSSLVPIIAMKKIKPIDIMRKE